MNAWARRLFAHYEAYHAYGPPRLKYMGWLGAITYVAFFFLRFTRSNTRLWDDFSFRLVAVVLFLGLALKDQWPARVRRWYIPYSYGVLLYCLPTFTILVALERHGGTPAISNAFIVLCFLVLLTDWRNTLAMLVLGAALASGFYVLTVEQARVPMDLIAQLPAYTLIVIGGNLFKFSTEQIEAERKLLHTQALAGSIAHELRQPLAQVRNSLEQVQRALPAAGTASEGALLDEARLEALFRHLSHGELAIERGLQVVTMTLDEVSARPLDSSGFALLSAAAVVHKAVEEYSYPSEAARAHVDVIVQEDFEFLGDETAYLFVLFNLLKNALHYLGPYPGTRVRLSVAAGEVRVRDTGPGIAPQQLANLFEPFRSVGKVGGTGLGLAYCKRVMHAFGGSIHCESVVGRFAEFIMRFPAATRQARQEIRDQLMDTARASLNGLRLLLVEDDAVQRAATRRKLGPLGVWVDEAADGQLALELLARHRYDLVLLDLHMPVLDGWQLALRIREGQVPANRHVRLVAHTSEPTHLARIKAQRAGIDEFVQKPCSQAALARALQRALSRACAANPAQARPLDGLRILLADDSAFNRHAVAAYVREAGGLVVEASHGAGVLDALEEGTSFHVVLMDLNMPGLDGLEATRAIRGSAQPWSTVPIVALTAHSDSPAIAAARAAGMNAFLVKPVEPRQLHETIATVLAGPAPSPLAPTPAVKPAPVAQAAPLLNTARLESHQRLGLLEELISDYLPEIRRLVGVLGDAVCSQDFARAQDSLHSLLGISGEAGALALYQQARRIYVPVLEDRRWPQDPAWLEQLQQLARDTEAALCEWEAAHSPGAANEGGGKR